MRSPIEKALPIVAAAYGDQFGIEVVLGSEAKTDGHRIWLPALTDESLHDLLWGYLTHEAAHLRFTDFSVGPGMLPPVFRACNILEDVRIERGQIELYPGTRRNLAGIWDYLESQGKLETVSVEAPDSVILLTYLLFRARYQQWQTDLLKRHFEQSKIVAEQVFPEGFFLKLDVLFDQHFDQLDSTAHCAEFASAIFRALAEAEQEAASEAAAASTDASAQTGDDGAGDGSESASDTGDSQDGGDSGQVKPCAISPDSSAMDGQDGGSSASCSAGTGGATTGGATTGGASTDDASTDGADQDGLGAPITDAILASGELPADVMDAVTEMLNAAPVEREMSATYRGLQCRVGDEITGQNGSLDSLHAGIQQSARLRAQVTGLLQAQSRSRQILARTGRRVDTQRLARVATGSEQVFRRREVKAKVDTAVHVLLDCSGSMDGKEQAVANQATVALALAVGAIPKAHLAVSVFPGLKGTCVSPLIRRGVPARPNLQRFAVRSGGGTPTAEAMLYGARDLAASHADRQVMVVITDGEPNDEAAVQYVNKVVAPHMDVYAVGICHQGVLRDFRNAVVIEDVAELQAALFRLAKQFLNVA